MADDKALFLIGGLGLLYLLFSKSASAGPSTYPPGTVPGTGYKPPGSGGSSGGGSGGGSFPGGTSGAGPGSGGAGGPRTTYVCSNGSLVTDPSLCPVGPNPVGGECADSTYVNDVNTQCPENVYTYTDTYDPCDPMSIAYNPAQCGMPTGTATGPDTMDPCDPLSVMYQPSECYAEVVNTCLDTGDICNPEDCNYDPNSCSG
jgi:hypothetical protein